MKKIGTPFPYLIFDFFGLVYEKEVETFCSFPSPFLFIWFLFLIREEEKKVVEEKEVG